ncbi:ABC transporter permease [Paracoccus zhejiangensis]|nr:ABC transporter permease [Paracoccus zhejiangensis]
MEQNTATAPQTDFPVQHVGAIRFQASRIIAALILREASSRFGKSAGGYFWSIAEPAAGVLLLSIAFGFLLAKPPIGSSFFLFYTSGVVPLLFFNTLSNALAQSVASNKGLLSYPVVSILEVIVARTLLELMTYSAVFVIITLFVVQVDNIVLHPDLLQVIVALLLTALLGMAVGMANCILFVHFPIWRNIWRILTRPMLIISGVMFTYDRMPESLKEWLWYNPLLQNIGVMRGGLYAVYNDSYVSYTYIIGVCLFIIAVSAAIIRADQGRLIEQ